MVLDERLTGYEAEVGLGKPVEIERQVPQGFGLVNVRTIRLNVSHGAVVGLLFSKRLDDKQQLPKITIKTPGETVHNIAIVDALAGGMEIENPRLATSAQAGEPEGDEPDHVEFLDDRVVPFCTADSNAKTFRYSLRVITAGQSALPPIQASCMYDESVACLGQAGRVTTHAK
jgi:hypothetical protein